MTIFTAPSPGLLRSLCGRWEIHRWDDWIGKRFVVWDMDSVTCVVKPELEMAMEVCK